MFNEQRQSMVQRLKVVEKEREGLESKKAEAESFLDKQVQLLTHKATAALINVSKFKVSEAGSVWGRGRGSVWGRRGDGREACSSVTLARCGRGGL